MSENLGRAAHAAYWRALVGDDQDTLPYDEEDPEIRLAWDASAQAAIDAMPGAIIHIGDELTEEEVADLRERFAAAVRSEPVAVVASRDSVAPELAAAMAEARALHALVAEMLDAFVSTSHGLNPAVVREKQITEWRERAGIETP